MQDFNLERHVLFVCVLRNFWQAIVVMESVKRPATCSGYKKEINEDGKK
jgi:hypothetical protein